MTLGLTTADWQQLNDSYLMSKNLKDKTSTSGADESIFKKDATDTNGNKCTDGKDDGKIGFFSALGNAVEGAVKGLWNGVKSCFTDSEGNFSLSKTLLTVGVGALCVAFPVVGAVACGVGAVVGGTKMVKGVSKALSAETDAEAKAAWESVGDGGATLVGSVVGAKGCLGAMKASSTAGLSSVDDIAKALSNTDDVALTLKNCGVENVDEVLGSVDDLSNIDEIMNAVKTNGKGSALGQLDDNATIMDKANAFKEDALSSTKNNGQKVWTKAKEVKADVDDYQAIKKAESRQAQAQKDYDNALQTKKAASEYKAEMQKKYEAGEVTKEELVKARKDWKKTADELKTADDNLAKAKQETSESIVNSYKKGNDNYYEQMRQYQNNKQALKDAKADLKATQKDLKAQGIKGDEYKAQIEPKVQAVADAKAQTITGQAKAKVTGMVDNSETVQYFKNLKPAEKTKFVEGLKTMKNNFSFKQMYNSMSADAKKIVTFLTDDGGTYAQAVQEFGYNNVAEVLATVYGFQMSSNAI